MKLIVRLTAFAVVVALSLASAPRFSHAGAAPTPTAKDCFFVRNHLPCPCPRAGQARALVHAARNTSLPDGAANETTSVAF
jgi:hypothetical protein